MGSKASGKTWKEKVAIQKSPKRVRLDADFAGVPAGSMLCVGTPQIVDDYVKRIPCGETRTIQRLRRELARRNDCDAMCPVSTAIFLRMVAEAAWEDLSAGAGLDAVTPFWRVVEPGSTLAKKLPMDDAWLQAQRDAEAGA